MTERPVSATTATAAAGSTVIFDADSHVMEPADLWERYLEPEYRGRGPRIVERDGVEQLLMGDQVLLAGNLAGLGGVHIPRTDIFTTGLRYVDGCPPASYDPAERVRLYDDWGITGGLVFPTLGILPFDTDDEELRSACSRAYNTWQAEFAAGTDGRAVPVAHLNLADLDGALRELDRCLELGFRAVFLPPEPVNGVRPGQPHFDPLWRRCAEAGIPACLHVVVRFSGAGVPFEPWQRSGAGLLFGFTLGAPGQVIPTVTSMVLDGVFDRVPGLDVLCVEAGCGWAAYLMDRIDEKHGFFEGLVPSLDLAPSEYLRRNVWYVAEPGERTIDAMCDLVGEDRILWGSDFPHIDSTLDAPDLVRATVEHMEPGRRAKVLGGNAVALFGLDPAATAPRR